MNARSTVAVGVGSLLLTAWSASVQVPAATAAECVVLGVRQQRCQESVAKTLRAFATAVIKCHTAQAKAAFALGSFADEACEAKARQRLTKTLTRRCDPQLRRAATRAATDLERMLDVDVNRTAFCDPAGPPLDATGEEAGFVPSTKRAANCGGKLGTAVAKLMDGALQCLGKTSRADFSHRPFDEDRCRTDKQSAFRRAAAKLGESVGCPPCLDARSLPEEVRAFLDTQRTHLLPCVSGAFFTPVGTLDTTPPTATGHQREVARRLDRDETGAFATFTGAPFAADTTLDPTALIVLHLAANQPMEACAEVTATIERIGDDASRTVVGTGLATAVTLPQASAKPSPAIGLDVTLTNPIVSAGSRLALTVAVTNRCRGNRGVSLDYGAVAAASRLITAPPPGPPANDVCETPFEIPVDIESDTFSTLRQRYVDIRDTTSATTSSSDPLQSCTLGGASQSSRSVWYSYDAIQPPMIAFLTIDTSTSSYATVVTLYQGTCDAPVEQVCGAGRTSTLLSFINPQRPFLIEVTDVSPEGRGGRLHLELNFEGVF